MSQSRCHRLRLRRWRPAPVGQLKTLLDQCALDCPTAHTHNSLECRTVLHVLGLQAHCHAAQGCAQPSGLVAPAGCVRMMHGPLGLTPQYESSSIRRLDAGTGMFKLLPASCVAGLPIADKTLQDKAATHLDYVIHVHHHCNVEPAVSGRGAPAIAIGVLGLAGVKPRHTVH